MRRTSAPGDFELAWFKSSYSSNGNEGDCVEIATAPGTTHVRDSKSFYRPAAHLRRRRVDTLRPVRCRALISSILDQGRSRLAW